jgi:hypothetical protein
MSKAVWDNCKVDRFELSPIGELRASDQTTMTPRDKDWLDSANLGHLLLHVLPGVLRHTFHMSFPNEATISTRHGNASGEERTTGAP